MITPHTNVDQSQWENRPNVTQALFWNQESKIKGVKTMKEWLKSPGGHSHMKQTGMLVENFEFNP